MPDPEWSMRRSKGMPGGKRRQSPKMHAYYTFPSWNAGSVVPKKISVVPLKALRRIGFLETKTSIGESVHQAAGLIYCEENGLWHICRFVPISNTRNGVGLDCLKRQNMMPR